MNREFLTDLLTTPSVSGYEETIQKKALAYGREFTDTQLTDPSGNAVSVVNPKAPHKILLCGHIDEIGFVVTHIDDSGRLHLTGAGGVQPRLYVGSPVQVWHEGNLVHGVIATSSDLVKKDKVEASDLLVDLGANSKEEAEKIVSVGDPVCADVPVRELMNDCFTCRALDDRTGAFVVLEAAREAAVRPDIEIEPQLEEKVDFDTFCKSDFRVVKVKACNAVKKSAKLLRFTLDDGTGVDRQILSGIHQWYEPEDLVGKTLAAIVNLPPRKMMGLESCGMLISAVHTEHGEERLNLLMVDDRIPAGAKLC